MVVDKDFTEIAQAFRTTLAGGTLHRRHDGDQIREEERLDQQKVAICSKWTPLDAQQSVLTPTCVAVIPPRLQCDS